MFNDHPTFYNEVVGPFDVPEAEPMDCDTNEVDEPMEVPQSQLSTPVSRPRSFEELSRSQQLRRAHQLRSSVNPDLLFLAVERQLYSEETKNLAAAQVLTKIIGNVDLADKVRDFLNTLVKEEAKESQIEPIDGLAFLFERDFTEEDYRVSFNVMFVLTLLSKHFGKFLIFLICG